MKKPQDPSTPDQERVRAVANRIKAIMIEEGMGGTITLASKESAEWLIHLPEWSGIQFDGAHGVRIHFDSKDNDNTTQTLGMVAAIRDNAKDYHNAFKQIFDVARAKLAERGIVVNDSSDRPPLVIMPIDKGGKDDN